jgi:hypothetical protein
MPSMTKINGFVEKLAEKSFNLGSDQLVIALSNTDPTTDGVQASTAAAVLATVTQISYTNLSSRNLTTSTSAQTSGTYDLILNDLVLTASGTVPDFRYVYVYDDTATNDELIGVYDHGSTVSMVNLETYTIDFTGDFINLT